MILCTLGYRRTSECAPGSPQHVGGRQYACASASAPPLPASWCPEGREVSVPDPICASPVPQPAPACPSAGSGRDQTSSHALDRLCRYTRLALDPGRLLQSDLLHWIPSKWCQANRSAREVVYIITGRNACSVFELWDVGGWVYHCEVKAARSVIIP